jgi:hypothetical protein
MLVSQLHLVRLAMVQLPTLLLLSFLKLVAHGVLLPMLVSVMSMDVQLQGDL